MDALLERWEQLTGSPATGRELLQRWDEPHRGYHNRLHLTEVLAAADRISAGADRTEAVALAAFWHDAVYDPARGDNEQQSALLATDCLHRIGLPAPLVAEVARLVLLTAGHDPGPGDRNGAVLCDADLAVLAADPLRYTAYAAGVRREYAHVPEPLFRQRRAELLAGLLAHGRLFRTDTGSRLWEAAARRNVTAEISRLTAGSGAAATRPPSAG